MSANSAFAPKRRKRITETPELAAAIRRLLAAYRRRVAVGDIDELADLASLAREVDDITYDAVAGLIAKGYSYTDVAARLGITRQAAWQRFGRKK